MAHRKLPLSDRTPLLQQQHAQPGTQSESSRALPENCLEHLGLGNAEFSKTPGPIERILGGKHPGITCLRSSSTEPAQFVIHPNAPAPQDVVALVELMRFHGAHDEAAQLLATAATCPLYSLAQRAELVTSCVQTLGGGELSYEGKKKTVPGAKLDAVTTRTLAIHAFTLISYTEVPNADKADWQAWLKGTGCTPTDAFAAFSRENIVGAVMTQQCVSYESALGDKSAAAKQLGDLLVAAVRARDGGIAKKLVDDLNALASALPNSPHARDALVVALQRCASGGDADRLIQLGVGVDLPDSNGNTALHLACLHGDLDAATALVKNRAKSNARAGDMQITPMEHAASMGHPDIVAMLLTHGVDSEEFVNTWGGTALHIACLHGCTAVVKVLIQHGAELTAQNGAGETPLDLALEEQARATDPIIQAKYSELVTLLQDLKAPRGSASGGGECVVQ